MTNCRQRDPDRRLRDPIFAVHVDRSALGAGATPRIWVLASGWLGYLEDGRLNVAADDLQSHGFAFLARGVVALDRAGGVYFGNFLFGHNRGLTFLDGQEVTAVAFEQPDLAPLPSHRVLDLAVDRRGQAWVAAQWTGLLRIGADRRLEAEEDDVEETRP